jgi:hypothetical protein
MSGGPGGSGARRAPQGSADFTTLSPVYELRELKIAYGIQFHPGESLDTTPQDYLNAHLDLSDDLEKVSDNEYINHAQGVRYTIEESTSKQQFITWLKTPDVHLIYMGHARYGRGPCFGARGLETVDGSERILKTEDWEEGSNDASGIFRMGYTYIGVDVAELLDHGYTANLVKESEGRPASSDCDPDLRPHRGEFYPRAPEQIHPLLVNQLRNHDDGDKYWSYGAHGNRRLVHHAGWTGTFSSPSDMGTLHDATDPDGTQMVCRVFTHLGCSTFHHNYPVVRRIANWRRDGNERHAYWTTDLSFPHGVGPWVHGVISYKRWNAFESWGPSLDWAVQRANRSLRALGASYSII